MIIVVGALLITILIPVAGQLHCLFADLVLLASNGLEDGVLLDECANEDRELNKVDRFEDINTTSVRGRETGFTLVMSYVSGVFDLHRGNGGIGSCSGSNSNTEYTSRGVVDVNRNPFRCLLAGTLDCWLWNLPPMKFRMVLYWTKVLIRTGK